MPEDAVATPVELVYVVAVVDFTAQPVPAIVHATATPASAFAFASLTVAVNVCPPPAAPAVAAEMSFVVGTSASTPSVV